LADRGAPGGCCAAFAWLVCAALVCGQVGCGDDAAGGDAGASADAGAPAIGPNSMSIVIAGDQWSVPIEAGLNAGEATVFGAEIAGSFLRVWGDDPVNAHLVINIDTAGEPVPGEVAMHVPGDRAWSLLLLQDGFGRGAVGAYDTFDQSGSITVNECPVAAGDRVTGTFNSLKLNPLAMDMPPLTVTGTFSVVVLKAQGSLGCASR
jgi:hypothetical protein